MVDAEAVEHPLAQPAEHEGVGVREHPLVLHAQADQGVDVEEAPVVELLAGGAPEGQPVVLALEQIVELVGIGVDLRHRRVEGAGDLGFLPERGGRAGRRAPPCRGAGGRCSARSVAVARGSWPSASAMKARSGEPHRRAASAISDVERAGRHRHPVLVVVDLEPSPPAHQLQLAVLQHPAVVVAQDGQQHGVAQPGLGGVPVDVEVGGVAARRAVLQHVPPPGVLPLGDRHVVGDDVEHLPEPLLAQRRAEPRVGLLAAQLLVDPRGIDHVVPMRAAPRRLEVRRAVEMADPEIGEIAGDRRGVVEAEVGAELDAIGREGGGHGLDEVQGVGHASASVALEGRRLLSLGFQPQAGGGGVAS